MLITVVIVTHNSAEVIGPALASVYKHPRVESCIVVDNASTDSTLSFIRRKFPQVIQLRNQHNQGFGRAANRALKQVKTEYVLLMNPDSTLGPHTPDALINTLEAHPNAAVVAPLLQDESTIETIQLREDFMRSAELPHAQPAQQAGLYETPFVSGAIALWRMSHLKRIGFFDPAIFLFYEDDDLCYRTHKKGYQMLLQSGLEASHSVGGSCASSPELEDLKLYSLRWSALYMRFRYQGRLKGYLYARRKLEELKQQEQHDNATQDTEMRLNYLIAMEAHEARYAKAFQQHQQKHEEEMQWHRQHYNEALKQEDSADYITQLEKELGERLAKRDQNWRRTQQRMQKKLQKIEATHQANLNAREQSRVARVTRYATEQFLRSPFRFPELKCRFLPQ